MRIVPCAHSRETLLRDAPDHGPGPRTIASLGWHSREPASANTRRKMTELSTIYRLSQVLSVVFALLGPAGCMDTSLGTLLDCWFVEEVGGRMSSFPSAVSQKKAVLLLRNSSQPSLALDPRKPDDLDCGVSFDVIDPTGRLLNPKVRRLLVSEDEAECATATCEVSLFRPQAAFVEWSRSLTAEQLSPPYLGSTWYASLLQDQQHTFSFTSIHREKSGPGDNMDHIRSTEVALNVFTRTPLLKARVGATVLLHCGFSAAWDQRFSVEWRYQFKGSGHVIYAYDGVKERVVQAQNGAELFFKEMHHHGNASLLLHGLAMKDEGTYLCIIYTPYLHAQQSVELRITEPPTVYLHPNPLYVAPGREQVLECEASAYYPLDVSVEWLLQNGSTGVDQYLTGSWQSSHRPNQDGTFTLSSYILVRGSAQEHGAVYTCYVSHTSLKSAAKKSIQLHVSGQSGPSMEDAIGLFITAFMLYGILAFVWMKVYPRLSKGPEDSEPEQQKDKLE